MVILAILDISVSPGATTLRVAMTLIIWLICSLPVAMLIGHCALSEE